MFNTLRDWQQFLLFVHCVQEVLEDFPTERELLLWLNIVPHQTKIFVFKAGKDFGCVHSASLSYVHPLSPLVTVFFWEELTVTCGPCTHIALRSKVSTFRCWFWGWMGCIGLLQVLTGKDFVWLGTWQDILRRLPRVLKIQHPLFASSSVLTAAGFRSHCLDGNSCCSCSIHNHCKLQALWRI